MANKTVYIDHAKIVQADRYVNGALLIEDGRIAAFGPGVACPDGAEYIDAQGQYVGPGLIDIHIHGCGGCSFMVDPRFAAAHALKHGVTSVLATLEYTPTTEVYLQQIGIVQAELASGESPNLRGIYMEGPFINPKYGANAWKNPWVNGIHREEYLPFVEKLGDDVLVWATAPEREGIVEFIQDAKKFAPNARFTVAHSEASAEQVEALIPLGLCVATHHMNATENLVKNVGCTRPGIDEAVHTNDCIYAELIADSLGMHVPGYMLRLILKKYKRRERIILISDAAWYDEADAARFDEIAPDLCFDEHGGLAGSRLTLDVVCRNMMRHTGCSVVDAFMMGATNAARMLGWEDRGEIAVGKVADLVCVDEDFNIREVLLGGELQ